MRHQSNNRHWSQTSMHLMQTDEFCGFHTTHEGHWYVHLSKSFWSEMLKNYTRKSTYESEAERLSLCNPGFKRINSKTSILSNLNRMSILFKNLDGKLLVDEIIFSKVQLAIDSSGQFLSDPLVYSFV